MKFSTEFQAHFNLDGSCENLESGNGLRNDQTGVNIEGVEDGLSLNSDSSNSKTTNSSSDRSVDTIVEVDGDKDLGGQEQQQQKEGELNTWSRPYVGIPIHYFSVGLIYAGSISILYPILIIQQGVTASFFAAASSLVTVFWSYKVFFGFLCDCFPIMGRTKKPYIIIGWALCAAMLVVLGSMGDNITPIHLVIMLTVANFGYVMADTAADGYMVWMSHNESDTKRGRIQTLVYIVRNVGMVVVNVVILLGFSGPNVNCPGYESDPDVPCTTDQSILTYVDPDLLDQYPETWCYQTCPEAPFNFGMTIPQFVWLIAVVNIISIPSYLVLKEEPKAAKQFCVVMKDFWTATKKRGVWQIMLYTMISQITLNVFIAPKTPANYAWLGLTNIQNQIRSIMESFIFALGLFVVRKYALDFSWRKMIWLGVVMVTLFNTLYLLIVYDIIRDPWFYIFIDVSDTFMNTLNWMTALFCIVEVAESGFEAVTYALITTASNATIPISSVISYQLMAFFPDLNTQEGIASDTTSVRNQFALLILITEVINLSSLAALPMLPRQRAETRELVKNGESSPFWAKFALSSIGIFLLYGTCVTFFTVAGADKYGCLKILGGEGCSENESSIPVILLIVTCFTYSYGLNFWFTFLPILQGKEKFSWSMFF